jgi:hypothetical protein
LATTWQPSRFGHARFAGIADLLDRFRAARDWPAVAELDGQLRGELAIAGVRLVESAKTRYRRLPDGTIDPATLYEVRIAERGEVATRGRSAHDLFNAVVWAAFPRSKLALSRELAREQRARVSGRTQLPGTRTRAHDRLALVDEGGVVVVRDGSWIFGHAIYEHAYAGQLDVRGTAIDLDVDAAARGDSLATARGAIDAALAACDLALAVRGGPGIPVP